MKIVLLLILAATAFAQERDRLCKGANTLAPKHGETVLKEIAELRFEIGQLRGPENASLRSLLQANVERLERELATLTGIPLDKEAVRKRIALIEAARQSGESKERQAEAKVEKRARANEENVQILWEIDPKLLLDKFLPSVLATNPRVRFLVEGSGGPVLVIEKEAINPDWMRRGFSLVDTNGTAPIFLGTTEELGSQAVSYVDAKGVRRWIYKVATAGGGAFQGYDPATSTRADLKTIAGNFVPAAGHDGKRALAYGMVAGPTGQQLQVHDLVTGKVVLDVPCTTEARLKEFAFLEKPNGSVVVAHAWDSDGKIVIHDATGSHTVPTIGATGPGQLVNGKAGETLYVSKTTGHELEYFRLSDRKVRSVTFPALTEPSKVHVVQGKYGPIALFTGRTKDSFRSRLIAIDLMTDQLMADKEFTMEGDVLNAAWVAPDGRILGAFGRSSGGAHNLNLVQIFGAPPG